MQLVMEGYGILGKESFLEELIYERGVKTYQACAF